MRKMAFVGVRRICEQLYSAEEEICSEWPSIAGMSLDSLTAVGYPVKGALIRYLNCLNLTKTALASASWKSATLLP